MWGNFVVVLVSFFGCFELAKGKFSDKQFPKDFLFGVATSAYQIEGGYQDGGKGQSIWDYFTETRPNFVHNSSNGQKSCDSYHKYKEDVQLVKQLGVDFYRFSISWTRILPTGYASHINPEGIAYYNNLINELLANDITPMVTMYHWDLPKPFLDIGGWTNPFMAYYYEDYVRILYENFGDRVKYWITFNTACVGYGDKTFPPFYNQPGLLDYLCNHVVVLAHAKAYHLYDREFRQKQHGKIGITVDTKWYEPASNSPEDIEAAERVRQFYIGKYGNPIFHAEGGYPKLVKKRVDEMSRRNGFKRSRLPEYSQEEADYVQGTYDFVGVNIYTTFLVENLEELNTSFSFYERDLRAKKFQPKTWPGAASSWLKVVPSSIRNILKWIKDNYDNPDIFITENGFSDKGQLKDLKRIEFYQGYLSSLLDSIYKDNVTVKGYAAWSLLDNFEWNKGFSEKFGLFHVDFSNENRTRTAKESAKWFAKVVKRRRILPYNPEDF